MAAPSLFRGFESNLTLLGADEHGAFARGRAEIAFARPKLAEAQHGAVRFDAREQEFEERAALRELRGMDHQKAEAKRRGELLELAGLLAPARMRRQKRGKALWPALFTGSRNDGAEICFSRALETGEDRKRHGGTKIKPGCAQTVNNAG
jgi:hypothetical protein